MDLHYSKQMKYTFTALLMMSLNAFASQVAPIEKIKQTLKFKEGVYALQKNKGEPINKNCPGDQVDLKYETDQDSFVLRLGEEVIFAELNKVSYKEASDIDCESEIFNKLSANDLQQEKNQTCKDQKNNYKLLMQINQTNQKLEYSFKKKLAALASSAIEYKCEYKYLNK